MRAVRAAQVTICIGLLGTRHARGDSPSCERGPLQLIRYEEDHSFLRDPACRTELWDPVKYMPLTADPSIVLSLGGDVRERFEYVSDPDWGRGPDDGYLLQRYMLHADLLLGTHARTFAQLTSNFATDRSGGPGPVDENRLDLHQAFLDVELDVPHAGPLTIRAGRQEIDYEDARLITVREGANVRLSFDAVRVMQRAGDWRVDLFAAAPVETDPGVFDDGWEPGQRLWGAFAFGPILADALALDVFYFGFSDDEAVFDQGTADESRHSIGVRASGTPGALDYNVELVYQLGSFGAGDIRAWMVASDTGYTFDSSPARPRLGIQLNATSGDKDPLDLDLQTFNPLFPQASYFTDANLIGPLNHVDVHPMLSLRLIERLAVALHYDVFWRTRLADGLYRTSGALIVTGQGTSSRHVGSELALRVQWQLDRHATLVATYSHFFVGPFLEEAGHGHDLDFFAMWLSYRF